MTNSGQFVKQPLAHRFWSKVKISDNCWIWDSKKNNDGYGRFCIGSNKYRISPSIDIPAHHVSYYLKTGEWIPSGFEPDHTCKNVSCVRWNFGHLECIPREEHLLRTALTHPNIFIEKCPYGHEYKIHGVTRLTGSRFCNACNRLRQSARKQGLPYAEFMMSQYGIERRRQT